VSPYFSDTAFRAVRRSGFCSTSLDQSSALQTEAVTTRCRRVKIDREARRDSFRRARLYDRLYDRIAENGAHELQYYSITSSARASSVGGTEAQDFGGHDDFTV
jgi:hypothetical protein